jgi:hypothetical protein
MYKFEVNIAKISVVDPVGSETYRRIQILIWIRKNHSGSGQLRIRNEFEEKLP